MGSGSFGEFPPQFGTGPRRFSADSLQNLASRKSLCYLYCHFADTIPNSAQVHRLGAPGFVDNKDSLQSNTGAGELQSEATAGRAALERFSVGNFFFSPSLSFFLPAPGLEETQLKSSLPTNKFQPPAPCRPMFTST